MPSTGKDGSMNFSLLPDIPLAAVGGRNREMDR